MGCKKTPFEPLSTLLKRCFLHFSKKQKPPNYAVIQGFSVFSSLKSGATKNRTRDTRIFSPLLYQLSYGTFHFAAAKVEIIFEFTSLFVKKLIQRIPTLGY